MATFKTAETGISLSGMAELAEMFAGLGSAMRNRIARKAVRDAARPSIGLIKKRFTATTRKGNIRRVGNRPSSNTGALRGSIGMSKVKTYPRTGQKRIFVVVVGVTEQGRHTRAVMRRIGAKLKRTPSIKSVQPTNYGHLVEHGHVIATAGRRPLGASTRAVVDRKKNFNLLYPGRGRKRPGTGRILGRVKPYPFLNPVIRNYSDRATKRMAIAIREGIQRETSRFINKVKPHMSPDDARIRVARALRRSAGQVT